jgi:hypothetical protein
MSVHEGRDNHHAEGVLHIHLPAPSYQPFLLAAGVLLMAVGLIWTPIVSALGLFVLLIAIVGWTQELRAEVGLEEEQTTYEQ